MSATGMQYELATQDFTEDVGTIADDVTCTILFGSVARGDVLPGQSDMMDAFVFLRDEVFEDKDRFLNAIEVLSRAFERIAEKAPGPFHPFFYWNERDPVPAHFHFEMTRLSKVLSGADIRDRIQATDTGRSVSRTSFFEMRRLGSPLMVFLRKDQLTEGEREALYRGLVAIMRDIPMCACMALNIWVGGPNAVERLEAALPGLNFKVLDRINLLRHKPNPTSDSGELCSILREAMEFVEDLNDRLLSKLDYTRS
jgi:predicted nucleotidyltransferase